MYMKRFFSIILVLLMIILSTGCSDKKKLLNPYEKPVQTLFSSLNRQDSNSYINSFASPIVKEYKNSEAYDLLLAETVFSQIDEQIDFNITALTYEIEDKTEIQGEDLKNLSDQIQKGLDLKKAYSLNLNIETRQRITVYSCKLDIVVGKIGSNWYICESPNFKFDFSAS